jgi:rRNA maturation RNase YbeY
MINFSNTTAFNIPNKKALKKWLSSIITQERHVEGELNFLFCDDDHLHQLNVEFLAHDTLTDILTFDYNVDTQVFADICISIDRIYDNAAEHQTTVLNELHRVMAHGVLHLCGYKDGTNDEKKQMRKKEDEYLSQLEFSR